jgi:hypothetical protein
MRDVEVVNASGGPLPGRHRLWLEGVSREAVEGFRTYPLESGFREIVRT